MERLNDVERVELANAVHREIRAFLDAAGQEVGKGRIEDARKHVHNALRLMHVIEKLFQKGE